MVILLIVLTVVLGVALLFGYMVAAIETGMGLHTLYILHKNCKHSLGLILKPGVLIKRNGISYHWEKTNFGDFETRWLLIDPESRKEIKFDIIMKKNGTIVKIAKYEINHIKDYLRDGVDLEPFTPKR